MPNSKPPRNRKRSKTSHAISHRSPFKKGQTSSSGKERRLSSPGPRKQTSQDHPQHVLDRAYRKTQQALAEWRSQAPSPPSANSGSYLDPWQQDAVTALQQGSSVVVDAPTTAGKTRVVEHYFQLSLKDPEFRAVYTCPVKSLSNDKLREFREIFGKDMVGIATGDFKENLHAPILVSTLETYRNSLLGVEPDLGRHLAVFDEYHYLQDVSRGSAWEEAMILTPPSCQLLLLSASVENAREFASWLARLQGRDCELIRVDKRPVPLEHLVFYGKRWYLQELLPKGIYRKVHSKDLRSLRIPPGVLVSALCALEKEQLIPCIAYAGRRMSCELLTEQLASVLQPVAPDQARQIRQELAKLHEEFSGQNLLPERLQKYIEVYGIAYHHSGLPAPARMAIESLVKEGHLRFCVATMGLSLGINFSVKAAMITDFIRPGESGFTKYSPTEVLQMLGRAGRRGRDQVGFSCWPTPESYSVLGNVHREPIISRLKNDPTTFLGLVGRGFNLKQIERFYRKSFLRHKQQQVDLTLITPDRVLKKTGAEQLPCSSPAHEFAAYCSEVSSLCETCPLRDDCHDFLIAKCQGDLVNMHLHLHDIGALNAQEQLTAFGDIARYFPQDGGLLIARMVSENKIRTDNFLAATELMAALCLPFYKKPSMPTKYHFPFNPRDIQNELERLYPIELFEEIYDPPFGRRSFPIIKVFNPNAGLIVREWALERSWASLEAEFANEAFGGGDIMALIYRTATLLQSISQSGHAPLREPARHMRDLLLREPLAFTMGPFGDAETEMSDLPQDTDSKFENPEESNK